jgi:hypothetical protein
VSQIVISGEVAAALRELRLLRTECERLVFRIRARNDAAVLAATEEDLDELIGFVAAEADHEHSRAVGSGSTPRSTRPPQKPRHRAAGDLWPPQPGRRRRCDPDPAAAAMPYRLGMRARKRPTPEDTATARRILLDGLANGTGIFELVGELEPLHPRNNTFPGEVFLHLAADALDWCGASRADPLPLEGIRERFLPECRFRGRQNKKLQFTVLAAAALHGGTEPDLLDEVAWWQTDDFWQYALFAAVAYIRAAANRAGAPIAQACQELALRPADPAP